MQAQRQQLRKSETGKEPTVRNLLHLKLNSQQGQPQFFAKYGVSSWGCSPTSRAGSGMSETLRRVGMLENLGTRLLDQQPNQSKSPSSPSKSRRKVSRGSMNKPPSLDCYHGSANFREFHGRLPQSIVDGGFATNVQEVSGFNVPVSQTMKVDNRPALSEETEPQLMRELLMYSFDLRKRQDLGGETTGLLGETEAQSMHAVAHPATPKLLASEAGDSWSVASADALSTSSFSSFSICSALNLHGEETRGRTGRQMASPAAVYGGRLESDDDWQSV